MDDKLPPVVLDDDNPEWTEEDFARARPASEVFSPEILALLVRQQAASPSTEEVVLRLDRDVMARFRATGPGWQTRINEALRRAVGL